MFKLVFGLLIFVTFTGTAFANVEMSLSSPDESLKKGSILPKVFFVNEMNQAVEISQGLEGRAILLLPFYAHCKSTCPLNVSHLKNVLEKLPEQNYRVVLFSFDPKDTWQDLKDFREALKIPSTWSILRASAKDTNQMLEALDFRFMTQGVDFVHSNTLVVLSPERRIIKFIQGLAYSAEVVDNAIREARTVGRGTLSSLIFLTSGISLGVLIGFFFWIRQRDKDPRNYLREKA